MIEASLRRPHRKSTRNSAFDFASENASRGGRPRIFEPAAYKDPHQEYRPEVAVINIKHSSLGLDSLRLVPVSVARVRWLERSQYNG